MNEESGSLNRKQFLSRVVLAGVATQLPWLVGCDLTESRDKKNLSNRQAVLEVIWPSNGDGPGAMDVYADKYINWVLSDTRIQETEHDFVRDKFEQVFQLSKEDYGKEFKLLGDIEQVSVIQSIAETQWGKTFISRLITLIGEAMFTHPIYGGNPDEIGWKWIEFKPGRPMATEELKYPNIFDAING